MYHQNFKILTNRIMITLKCNFCGNEFFAERISAKYCTNSCKTLACRERQRLEAQTAIYKEKQRIYHEQTASALNELNAEHERMLAEIDAKNLRWQQEQFELKQQREIQLAAVRQKELVAEKEGNEMLRKERERQLEKHKKKMKEGAQLNTLLGVAIVGALKLVSELTTTHAINPDLKPAEPNPDNHL
jgi:uncharacterized OB-fold protein